ADLKGIRVVLVAATGAWSESMLNRLVTFAGAGGSILWFWSDPQAPANAAMWNRHSDVRQKIPLPSGPVDPRAGPVGLVPADPTRPPLDLFEQTGRRTLQQVRITRRFGPLGRSKQMDLLRFDRGGAALTVRRVGDGRMAVAPFGLDPATSTLGREASVFVPLLHGLVDAWSSSASPIAFRPGQRVRLEHESKNPRWRLVGPSGLVNHRVRQFADRYRLNFEAPKQAGFVELFDGDERVDRVAVNFDPRESNPNRSPVPENRSPGEGSGGGSEEPSEGTPLWPWLVIAALGVLGLEMALLGVWSR
ncbi:MAG: hypothetical protein R3236_10940, partial [Phycisphaeraceae bacterium]|nr:hypothetical protein [Phycisphaeraceae bacterium]